jgi:hypothetical protein
MIIPEVAAGAAAELADLRAACDTALARLRCARPDVLVVVGTGEQTAWRSPDEYGTLRPWGVPMDVPPTGRRGPGTLPLSLTIGAWLLCQQSEPVASTVVAASVAADETPAGCAAFGRDECAGRAERVALLAIGDGSALAAVMTVGEVHADAEAFDAEVARALGTGDVDALLALDPEVCVAVVAGGRPAWQVLAGCAAGAPIAAELLYSAAPYEVRYHVASWVAR